MKSRRKEWTSRNWTACVAAALVLGAGAGIARAGYDAAGANDVTDAGMRDMTLKNREMLMQTLSEEKTEIAHLASQQAMMRRINTPRSNAVARLYGRFIREHKAGAPMLERLIRMYGGDPAQTGVLKPAMLSDDLETMVRTMEQAHERAVMTSQMRYAATDSAAIQRAMHMRANMARKHLRLMQPYDR